MAGAWTWHCAASDPPRFEPPPGASLWKEAASDTLTFPKTKIQCIVYLDI